MCPVSATLAVTAMGMSGVAATVAGYAISGALIGVATNAAVNIATGRGAFDNAGRAALFGGISGGFGGASGFTGPLTSGWETVRNIGGTIGSSGIGIAATTAVGAIAGGMMPSTQGYTPVAAYNQQALNMNTNIATTGSGGRQAAKSLATAISRTKKRKLTQRDVGDLSLSTESFTNTGLQLA